MIYWIRHGETSGNRERRVQVADTPLSERGLEQAERLAGRLREAGLVRLLSSDLPRARMTAEVLGRATGLAPELHDVYQERNFGDLRGTLYADLGFELFGPDVEPPAGESWPVFHARVARAWEHARAVAAEAGGPIAIVTHGLVLDSVLGRYLRRPGPPYEAGPLRFGNTSVSITVPVSGSAAQLGGGWRIDLMDCTAHLDPGAANDAEAISGI